MRLSTAGYSARRSRRVLAWALGLSAGAGAASPARAQLLNEYLPRVNLYDPGEPSRSGSGVMAGPENENAAATTTGVTVLTRPHPEYDAQGVRVGDAIFNASGSEGVGYDSNPLGLPSAQGSAMLRTRGAVSGRTDYQRSNLTAAVAVDDTRYLDLPAASNTNWMAEIGGDIAIGRDKLNLAYSHLNLNVLPTNVATLSQALGVTSALPYAVDDVRAQYVSRFGRVILIPSLEYSMYRFNQAGDSVNLPQAAVRNAVLADTVGADQTINDRNAISGAMTAEYELSTGRNLVVVARDTSAHFTQGTGLIAQGPNRTQLARGALPNRDYNDAVFLAGIDFQAAGNLRYRLLGGYEVRVYENSAFGTQETPTAEAQAIWTPTELTTLTATASRQITDAIASSYSSLTYTTGRVQADHELRRNLILSGYGQIQSADFQLQNQQQMLYQGGLSLTYAVNRHANVVGSFDHTSQVSNVLNYDRDVGLVTFRLAL